MRSNSHGNRLALVKRIGVTLVLTCSAAGYAAAKDAGHPLVPGYGALIPAEGSENAADPSLRYRVAFEITRAASDTSQVNPALDRVARFMNLLSAAGIRPNQGDVVIVIHGPATSSILNDAAYGTRFHTTNPNTPLIAALQEAGVTVHVCSYALANQKIERTAVAKDVTIDVAAMITLATLQLKGWSLIAG